jgi:hypothetical protein
VLGRCVLQRESSCSAIGRGVTIGLTIRGEGKNLVECVKLG